MNKIRVAIVGYGNIGRCAVEAVFAAPDMEIAGIIRRKGTAEMSNILPNIQIIDEKTDISALGKVDVALLCKPTRQIKEYAEKFLSQGIHTVDSFDIHDSIVDLRRDLDSIAKKHQSVAIISAGWDPGSDSCIRALLEAAAPIGITYTDFGPGMSMGHTVAVKAKPGVIDALSVTIPKGTGVHRRMVYIQVEEGMDIEQISQNIKTDPYFCNDETYVISVPDVSALTDKGHGVHLTRKGRSSGADNQLFTFDMRINNPALTAQIMISCARAACRQSPGAYTIIEIPLIDLLPGDREGHIRRLV